MNQVFKSAAPMENSYPSSESGGELEVANDWLKQAIQKEVFRGTKLRERKVRPPLEVTGKLPKLPTPARSICKERRKSSPSPNRSNGLVHMRGRARSNSPFIHSTRTNTPESGRDSSANSARRGRPVCSMRISELAAPTKRQCIDTWRNKSAVLPGQMVYRLKQQVMDQTPIVKVSDAVNCFRQVSSAPTKKRAPMKINKEAIKSRNQEENKYISTIFGHRLAQKLIKPVNAKLNTQWQNVSSIVGNEICDVMRDKSKLNTNIATHERMVRETADKVTIWIANILEETSEKLLEEDLRVQKVNNRTLATDGELITLIGTMVRQEAELEEHEGPALDILDDLVEKVVSVCGGAESDIEEIFELSTSIAQKSIDEDNAHTGDISTPDYISVSSENNDGTETKETPVVEDPLEGNLNELNEKPVEDKDSLKDHMMRQLNEIIDSKLIDTIKSHDILEKISNELDNQTESQTNIDEKRSESLLLPLAEIKVGISHFNDTKLSTDNQEYDHEKRSSESEKTSLDDPLNQLDEANSDSEQKANVDKSINNFNNDTTETKEHVDNTDDDKVEDNTFLPSVENVNDTIDSEISKNEESNVSEELSEERDKKVQFSYDNFGHLKRFMQLELIHSNDSLYQHIKKLSEQTTSNVIQEKKISPPIESTLRIINEPWPEDLSATNLTKPGESVSKSVTSLGKLLEADEKNNFSLEEESSSGSYHEFISQPHQESMEQFNNLGVYYDDFLGDNVKTNRNDELSSKLNERLDETNGKALQNIDEHDIKHTFETVSGENSRDYGPKKIIETKNQEKPFDQITDGEFKDYFGVPKSNKEKIYLEQEQSALLKDKDKEPLLSQLKPEIIKNNIKNESSEPSLVTMLMSKLQKCDDKLQDIISIPEQSDSGILKMHVALSERSKGFQHPQKRKLSGQIHQKHSRGEAMAAEQFDYRVHPNTAPSWIRRGRGQGDLGTYHKPMRCSDMNELTERERKLRKWNKDLDNILINLEKWKSWLQYITKYITSLKEKAELNKLTPRHHNKIVPSDRFKPTRNIEKDAMWTKLNHRAKGGLKLYKHDETIKFKISPTPASAKYCVACGCKKQMKRLSRSPTRK